MLLRFIAILAISLIQETPSNIEKPPVRVGGDVKPPQKIKDTVPRYPESARRAGLQGIIVLECVIDTKGHVGEPRIVKGVPPLSEAAIEAVKQWRYTPTVLNGEAVSVIMTVTVNFSLTPPFEIDGLLDSLKSDNEFVRESAVSWLGRARGLSRRDTSDILQALRRLAEKDPSELVRNAAAKALSRLENLTTKK